MVTPARVTIGFARRPVTMTIRQILSTLILLLLAAAASAQDYRRLPGGAFDSALAIDGRAAHLNIASFYLRSEPVTNAEFLAFVMQHPEWRRGEVPSLLAGPDYLSHWQRPLQLGESIRPDQPVTHVSWFAARAYCDSEHARLPSWYEWEYASAADATRSDARRDPLRNQAMLSAIQTQTGNPPDPIGNRPANYYGAHDLNRLLWEWTADYAAMFPNADSRVPGGVANLALCGGSALAFADKNQYALMMRVAALSALKPVDSAPRVGFRCVRDFPEE
ncbi:MAG: formylglycine-generating enzyme family protein [Pseudomonadota bacterium]|nr:formylglycine-generating enzyme family protein [Pseudomonadota bacterium]